MVIDVDAFTVAGVVRTAPRRVQLLDRDALALYLADLPDGTQVNLTISADDRPASPRLQQRRYWWAVVVPRCAKHFNTDDRRMSRDLLAECFGFEWSAFQQLVPVKASLSVLSADDMSTLLEWTRDLAAREGFDVPVPDKDWRIKR